MFSISWFGQTKQKLKNRLGQHRNDCKPTNVKKINTTALAEHHFKTGHNFKFDATTILDLEDNWNDDARGPVGEPRVQQRMQEHRVQQQRMQQKRALDEEE
ncbi:hypothetical protein M0804_012212 [Polistes exclamans]|nr:hypothetical protein M0804_012212 [Polistes exclamans]